MSFSIPSGPDALTGSGGLLSNLPAVRRQQLSRINAYVKGKRSDPKKTRALRKAQYKHQKEMSKLPKDVRDTMNANPLQHGAPRCFKVLLAGKDVASEAKLHDITRFTDEGHFIHFASFGIPGKAIRFNDDWIKSEHVTLSPDRRVYTVAKNNNDGSPFNVHLDFTQIDKPVGQIETPAGFLALSLQPWAVAYNVNISADAGAYFSTGMSTLVWDATSTTWQNANWEQNSMLFSYDTVNLTDPFGNSFLANEVSFQDPMSNSVSEYTAADYGTRYTSLFQKISVGGNEVPACVTTIQAGSIKAAPAIRSADAIKSVFPQLAIFQFDELATSFTGAFKVPQLGGDLVYAVIGTGIMPSAPSLAPGPVQPDGQIPLSVKANIQPHTALLSDSRPFLQTSVEPVPHSFVLSANADSTMLPVTGLINFDPMVPDATNSTGYKDSVAEIANTDFHDIICYYMDTDIHTTFISSSPATLPDSTVLSIATDDAGNAAFYKTLQVPYVTSSLGRSTLAEGKQCNTVRAEGQLKTLPANSPIYKRHSDALYRHRFMQNFPSVQNYLDDQAKTDYSQSIANGATSMKTKITQMSNGVNGVAAQDAADTLKAALDDIDSLAQWATSQKLFYAFNLYWWCENYYLPNLIAQSANGSLSASVSRTLKKLTLIFGILENGQQNPNGKSFTEAFNDLIRLFQMSTIIPQFVDADAASEDLDSIEKEMLQQFYTDNIGSSDPQVVAEAQRAQQLATNDFLRKNFFNSLATSMRLGGSLGSWAAIAQLNQNFLNQAGWYQKLANAADLGATFMRASCVALLVLPMINKFGGGWSAMSPEQKTSWVITAAALGLTFFIKGVQGGLRLFYFWDDLAGFTQTMKAFMGFKSVLTELPGAAEATENTFAQWFLRGSRETMEITGDEVSLGMKIFGRSAGEFLTNSVGAILAGVNIVMSAIDLAKTTDPLQKTMDSLFIVSSGLQLLAIGANWIVTAAIVTDELAVSILSTVAAVAGPLAIAFAVAGLVIMIVMACLEKDPPNPVQDFVDKHVAPAGLKLDYGTAIDYFNVVPSDATATSLNGISFQAQAFSSLSAAVLQLGAQLDPQVVEYGINPGSAISYLPDTCWNIKTDSNGITTIWTYFMDPVKGQQPLCLTETTDGQLHALPPPSKTTKDANGNDVPVDATVYAQQLSMQQWTFKTLAEATTTTRTDGTNTTTFVTSAKFSALRGSKFLTLKIQTDGTTVIVLDTVDNSKSTLQYPQGDPLRATAWTLTLQSMSPSSFAYIQQSWQLNTNQKDEQNAVMFTGSTSGPLSWEITPALPSFLQLSSSDGTIKQAPGVAPTVMQATVYTVTASIVIIGKGYSKATTVTITVSDATTTTPSDESILLSLDQDATFASGVAPENGAVRSRFAASNQTPSTIAMQIPSGGAAIDAASTEDVPDFAQLQHNFNAFQKKAPSFFGWQQPGAVALNQHYTANAAIARMQNSVGGSWEKVMGLFNTDHVSFESIYFPSPMANPPSGTNDPLDYGGAAQAFVAQCIYNGDGYAQAQCSLQEYEQSIQNLDWIAYKRATQANGGWANQSYEMYFHFLKLSALGATQDGITNLYNSITGDHGLVAGDFSDITPSTWMQYTGYLYNRLVTGNSPPSGCCFPAGTQIVLADGKETTAIENVVPGMRVLSPTRTDPLAARSVQSLSRPKRDGRALYIFHDGLGEVRFTATHPIFLRYDGGDEMPVLGFVDVGEALSVNSLWTAFRLETLPAVALVQSAAAPLLGGKDDEDELLYDLVLESPASQSKTSDVSVFVISQPGSRKRLQVCSEAPDVSALPALTRFVLAFLEAVGSRADAARFFPDGLRLGGLDYLRRVQTHRAAAATAVSTSTSLLHETSRFGKNISLETALSVIGSSTHDAQYLMDASEALASALGLGLQCHLDNGWQFVPGHSTDTTQQRTFCLSTHNLSLAQTSLLQIPPQLEKVSTKVLRALSATLLNTTKTSISFSVGTPRIETIASVSSEVNSPQPSSLQREPLHLMSQPCGLYVSTNSRTSKGLKRWGTGM
ncbi:hypothetical protein N0V83_011025 [Neocucurbitaria cava]|uniref:Hint domain-containing protein n=1 Tax=Neocucurbitaria cava TaxID=798079 RepID=A0A9W9CGG3_9PLEO|nr:hypothetical protein N0V83_011025 [Neocucurbitaria cava]